MPEYKEQTTYKGDQPRKLVAFVLPFEQDRPRGDPVKTEYDKDQGLALVESDEEAVELRSTAHLRMAAKHSAAIFVEPSGERFCKKPEGLKRATGQRARFRTAGARGQGERGSHWQS